MKILIKMNGRDDSISVETGGERGLLEPLVDALVKHIPASQAMTFFSLPITVSPASQQNEVEKIFRCYLLAQNSRESASVRQIGWQVQDFVNFSLAPDQKQWGDLPVVKRYQNKRLGLIADPEFLIISWCKKFENYDRNNSALLPSFPSDFNNRPLTPVEIRDVVNMWILRRMITHGVTRDAAKKTLSLMAPVLYDLVFDFLGWDVLHVVYDMLLLIRTDDTQPLSMREILLAMYEPLHQKLKKEGCAHTEKVGLKFMGWPHAMFRPELVLTVYILHKYIFLPYTTESQLRDFFEKRWPADSRYSTTILRACEKTTPKEPLRVEDYNPATKKNERMPVHLHFYPRKSLTAVKKYLGFQDIFYGHDVLNGLLLR